MSNILLKAARQAKLHRQLERPQGVDVAVLAHDRERPVSHIAKRGLLGDKRDRVEFGTIETHLGTVNVSHDQGADVCRLCHAAGASVAAPACSRPSVPQD